MLMRKGTVTTLAIVGLVLLTAIGFGLPFYAGMQTEKHFRGVLEALIQDSPLSVKELEYQRGVFGARASSALEWKNAKGAFLIPVDHEIQHGLTLMNPNLAKVVSTIRLPSEAPAELKALFKDQAPVTVTTLLGTDNGIRSELSSPPVTGRLAVDEAEEIQWQGIQGTVTLAPDWNRGILRFSAPSLAIQDGKGTQLLFEAGHLEGNLHRSGLESLWLGSNQFTLKRFSLMDRDEHGTSSESFRADQCVLSAEVAEKDRALEVVYAASIDRLKANGRDFQKAALEVKLSRIDLEGLQELRDRLRELNRRQLDETTRGQETVKLALDLLPRFLGRSPEIAVSRLTLGTPEGQVEGEGRVKYVGGRSLERFEALKDLEGEIRLTAPKPLVESIALTVLGIGGKDLDEALGEQAEIMKRELVRQRIGGLLEDGVILDQGTGYSTQVTLKEGVLTLNGKRIDLPGEP